MKYFIKDILIYLGIVFILVTLESSLYYLYSNLLFSTYLIIKAIIGNYNFYKLTDKLKNNGIFFTILIIILNIRLNINSFYGESISLIFNDYKDFYSVYWMIINPVLLYGIFLLIGFLIFNQQRIKYKLKQIIEPKTIKKEYSKVSELENDIKIGSILKNEKQSTKQLKNKMPKVRKEIKNIFIDVIVFAAFGFTIYILDSLFYTRDLYVIINLLASIYLFYKSIIGNYVISTPEIYLKNRGIALTIIIGIISIWLNFMEFSEADSSYKMDIEEVFQKITGFKEKYWLIVSPVLLYISFVVIGLFISNQKSLTKEPQSKDNTAIDILLKLKDSGKISAEDFIDEIREMKNDSFTNK